MSQYLPVFESKRVYASDQRSWYHWFPAHCVYDDVHIVMPSALAIAQGASQQQCATQNCHSSASPDVWNTARWEAFAFKDFGSSFWGDMLRVCYFLVRNVCYRKRSKDFWNLSRFNLLDACEAPRGVWWHSAFLQAAPVLSLDFRRQTTEQSHRMFLCSWLLLAGRSCQRILVLHDIASLLLPPFIFGTPVW